MHPEVHVVACTNALYRQEATRVAQRHLHRYSQAFAKPCLALALPRKLYNTQAEHKRPFANE